MAAEVVLHTRARRDLAHIHFEVAVHIVVVGRVAGGIVEDTAVVGTVVEDIVGEGTEVGIVVQEGSSERIQYIIIRNYEKRQKVYIIEIL